MTYRTAKWPDEGQVETLWKPFPEPVKRLGNHRAAVRFEGDAEAVRVRVPWRRRDQNPEGKAVVLTDADGAVIDNVLRQEVNREYGEFVFQPRPGIADYYLYFMPLEIAGLWPFPTVTYPPPAMRADPAWRERTRLAQELPEAEVVALESRSEFDRFTEMEMIATADEVAELRRQAGEAAYLLFPEDRRRPIRMTADLPQGWIDRGPSQEFAGQADRGAFFAFQIGVFALREPLEIVGFESTDLGALPAAHCRCLNLAGTDWLGREFTKTVRVETGKVQPLWFGIDVPEDAAPGAYEGTVALRFRDLPDAAVRLRLEVTAETIANHGDDDLWRHARLRWLDSTIGIEDTPTGGYPPLAVEGRRIECLGRTMVFGDTGLPARIQSRFSENVDSILDSGGRDILAAPMQMVVETAGGAAAWANAQARVIASTAGSAVLQAHAANGALELTVDAKMEFDGYTTFNVAIAAAEATDVADIRLEIPLRRDVAAYMMGIGHRGGRRAASWEWEWNEDQANNSLWIGDVNAGLYCALKGPEDVWELCNLKAVGLPESWANQGQGGCTVTEEAEDRVMVRAFSGSRRLLPGQSVSFRFAILPTPLKALDADHWNQRYCHENHLRTQPEEAAELGARIVNIHQGRGPNPYINYPFRTADAIRDYVDRAHAIGIKVKLYYTIRELSNHVYEMWALRSLGDEVFLDGPGFRLAAQCFPEDVDRQANGWAWLQEHLGDHFVPAWHQPLDDGDWDAAIATQGLSRWHNYYLEGLAWLIREVGIDGIYLDGIGYDREVMKRVRRAMDKAKPGCLIDFHSGNNFSKEYGWSSGACQYLEHFPYLDSLWFGEGFDADSAPDYWLVEMSGIPFGLFSEMLQNGGNPWRGMLYGMSNRLHWAGDPRPIWQLWDEFGIEQARLLGYWSASCPVQTNHPDILATVYARDDRALIAVASWAADTVECRLTIDLAKLRLAGADVRLRAPAVQGLQDEAAMPAEAEFTVTPGGGRFLILENAPV